MKDELLIQVKSSNGITLVPAQSRLLGERKVFIEGEICSDSALSFMRQILLLNRESAKPIDVLVNSVGGEIKAGMMMYDIIQSSIAPIRTWCVGKAYSMAALIVASGLNGRFVFPNSELMIHEPLLGSVIDGGSSSTIKTISDSLEQTRCKICAIFARHTGKTEAEIEAAIRYDHYFTSEEAVNFGLCDEIADFRRLLEIQQEV